MKKSKHLKYCKKVVEVLGYERLHKISSMQSKSLNNQLNDLIEENNFIVEAITDEAIIGCYDLVTKHLYPDEFVEINKLINKN